jgi:hypothetical protein
MVEKLQISWTSNEHREYPVFTAHSRDVRRRISLTCKFSQGTAL